MSGPHSPFHRSPMIWAPHGSPDPPSFWSVTCLGITSRDCLSRQRPTHHLQLLGLHWVLQTLQKAPEFLSPVGSVLPNLGPSSWSFLLLCSAPKIYISDTGQRGDHGPEWHVLFGTFTFHFSSLLTRGRTLEFFFLPCLLANCLYSAGPSGAPRQKGFLSPLFLWL